MLSPDILKIIFCILLACIPAYIWGYIFYKKEPEPRKMVAVTFIAGIIAVIPILFYKYLWKFFPQINVFLYTNSIRDDLLGLSNLIYIPAGILVTFMVVGVIEEYAKHIIVKIVDKGKFQNIDDAIEYSIIAALGFSFIENIMYFMHIWTTQGFENLFLSFIFRSIFSTFAHILFSGIYGYFYGIAYFATPILKEEIRNKKRFFFTKLIHKIIHVRSSEIFEKEKVTEGLIAAVLLHAFFNVMLEMNWTFLMVPFLITGYMLLDYLFKKKEDHKNYGKLLPERVTGK